MTRLLHLVLAVVVLIAQMGFAAVTCACPSSSAPVVASAEVCPMSGEPGCQCCGSHSQGPDRTVSRPDSGCMLASSVTPHTAVTDSFFPVVEALAEAQTLELHLPAPVVPVVCRHVVVPRIRPPDITSHGLRAPPLG